MVCLNDIPVNGNLAKIRRHVPGRDKLHFLFNQCPFFLCYIEFDLYFSFASVHAIAPFHSEGLGHFPTSNFQPTHRRTGGRKYGKGYSFPMLAKKVFYLLCPYFPLRRKNHFAELMQKKNAAISKKITTLPKIHIQFCRTFLLSSFSTSEISFAVAVTIRMPLSLISSSRASSCRRFVSFPTGVSKRNWSTDIL